MKCCKQLNSISKNNIAHRILIAFLAIMLGIAPFICKSANMFDFSNLPQSAYLQNISIVFLIIFFVNGAINKNLQIKWSVFYIPIGLLLFWSFISLFWATNPYEGVVIWLNWLAGGIIFFVVYHLLEDSLDIQIFLMGLILPVIFIIFVGLNQFLETNWFLSYPQTIGPAATFGNKNMMVDVLITLMPVSLFLTFQSFTTSKVLKVLGVFIYGVGVSLIVFSYTRAGMVAVVAQVVIFATIWVFQKRKRKMTSFLFYVVGIFLSVFVFLFLAYEKNERVAKNGFGMEVSFNQISNRIENIFKTVESDKWALEKNKSSDTPQIISDSRNMRLVTWQNTLVMFLDRPIFGVGLFNWQIHYGAYRSVYLNDPVYRPGMVMTEVHNDYLQILVDLGLPAVVLAIMLLYLNCHSIILTIKKGNDQDFSIAVILGLCLLGLHMVALFSFPFERSVPVVMFFLYTAFLAFFRDIYNKGQKNKSFVLNRKVCVAGVFLLVLLMSGILVAQNRRFEAEVEFKSAHDQHSVGNYEVAVQHAEKAIKLNPFRYISYFMLGYSQLCANHLEEAEKSLQKGLQYYPNDLNSLLQIGTTYTRLTMKALAQNGQETKETLELIQKAEFWFDKALKIRSDFSTVYFNKGVLFSQRAFYLKAQRKMEEASKYKKLAVENYKKALVCNPFYIDALNTLAQLLDEDQKKESIIYAEKAANILMTDFQKADMAWLQLENANVPKTSPRYAEASKMRKKTLQLLVAAFNKPLQILKTYYGSVDINLEKYLAVVKMEEYYFEAKDVETQEQLLLAEAEYNNKKSVKDYNPGLYLVLEQEVKNKKLQRDNFVSEKKVALMMLRINSGEVYYNMQKFELANQSFLDVINLAGLVNREEVALYFNAFQFYLSSAHLNLADILCIKSTVNNAGQELNIQNFLELSTSIEGHLKLVNLKLSEQLTGRFNSVSAKFLKLKEAAVKLQNNR